MRGPLLELTFLIATASAKWATIYNNDPSISCTNQAGVGLQSCCDCESTCPGPGAWEMPCGGDLKTTCTADQLIGPYGSGDGFNYTQVYTGDCGGSTCGVSHWNYTWSCCNKPVQGNWIGYRGSGPINQYCPMPPFFVGCTLPNEILIEDNNDCMNTTCPDLTIVSSAYLTGNQAVVNSTFAAALSSLITCAKNLGGKAKLSMANSSQCAKSTTTGETLSNGISPHQVGMAVDATLVLPDGTACNRTCMAQGYCAFHQSSSTCANSVNCPSCQGQPQNQQNTYINNFFTCAQAISGLKVGSTATTTPAWNHFEKAVKPNSTYALQNYAPQLKAFCMGLCPGKKKGTVAANMCSCAGFH